MANLHSTIADGQQDSADGTEAVDETTWVLLPPMHLATEPELAANSSSELQDVEHAEKADGADQANPSMLAAGLVEKVEMVSSMEGDAAWIMEPTEKVGDLEPRPSFSQAGDVQINAICIEDDQCSTDQHIKHSAACDDLRPTEESTGVEDLALDELCFRHFAPLLKASQAYASLSGCRFRSESFDGLTEASESTDLPTVSSTRSRDAGPRIAAKLAAAPVVCDFKSRLLANEPALVEELERAHRIVMSESVRNSMISSCQEYNMFPPYPPPDGIDDDDCAYQDTSEAFPAIAQRLYNDQVQRLCSAGGDDKEPQSCRLQRRTMTAAFIVDFAQDAGVVIPPIPEAFDAMISEFALRTAAWAQAAQRQPTLEQGSSTNADTQSSNMMTEGSAAAERWFPQLSRKKHQHPLLYAAGAVALGAAAVAGTTLGRRVRS